MSIVTPPPTEAQISHSDGRVELAEGVDLTDPRWIHVAIAARSVPSETKQGPASVCDQYPVAAVIGGLCQRAFPSTDPLGRVKPVKVGLRQQATIGTLPGPHVHHCDLRRVCNARSPDDRAAHPPSVISSWLPCTGSGQDWGQPAGESSQTPVHSSHPVRNHRQQARLDSAPDERSDLQRRQVRYAVDRGAGA